MKIKNFKIGANQKPFIIAELSANHAQSITRAYKIIETAYKAGASAVKLQTYKPELITINAKHKSLQITGKNNLWKNQSLYELYSKGATPWEWHKKLFKKIKKFGMIGFSSPFDESAVDFLEKLHVPLYKIASFELTHIPLLKKIAKTKKPVIISVGMGKLDEIVQALKVLKANGTKKIIILKCSSKYPSENAILNLRTIKDLKKRFKCEVGFSDHSIGITGSIVAVSQGATVIEKHLTLKKNDKGLDSAFSSDPEEFKKLVESCNDAWLSLGKIKYGPTAEEFDAIKNRRSIYVFKEIRKNEIFSMENIKIVRPAHGLEPKFFEKILNKKAKFNLKRGTPLKKKYIKNFR